MANEVNIRQIGVGTLDPAAKMEVYVWTVKESEYDKERKRVRSFTVAPDPWVPPETRPQLLVPGIVQMEITRVWNMVRTTIPPNFQVLNVFQYNVAVLNSGGQTTGWELLVAETNN